MQIEQSSFLQGICWSQSLRLMLSWGEKNNNKIFILYPPDWKCNFLLETRMKLTGLNNNTYPSVHIFFQPEWIKILLQNVGVVFPPLHLQKSTHLPKQMCSNVMKNWHRGCIIRDAGEHPLGLFVRYLDTQMSEAEGGHRGNGWGAPSCSIQWAMSSGYEQVLQTQCSSLGASRQW